MCGGSFASRLKKKNRYGPFRNTVGIAAIYRSIDPVQSSSSRLWLSCLFQSQRHQRHLRVAGGLAVFGPDTLPVAVGVQFPRISRGISHDLQDFPKPLAQ
jgi:hypothetical protein